MNGLDKIHLHVLGDEKNAFNVEAVAMKEHLECKNLVSNLVFFFCPVWCVICFQFGVQLGAQFGVQFGVQF